MSDEGQGGAAHRICEHIINPIITKFDGVRGSNIGFKVEDLAYFTPVVIIKQLNG